MLSLARVSLSSRRRLKLLSTVATRLSTSPRRSSKKRRREPNSLQSPRATRRSSSRFELPLSVTRQLLPSFKRLLRRRPSRLRRKKPSSRTRSETLRKGRKGLLLCRSLRFRFRPKGWMWSHLRKQDRVLRNHQRRCRRKDRNRKLSKKRN